MSKKIDLLKIKKKAYSILKKLKIVMDKNNYDKYMRLKEDYNRWLRIIVDDNNSEEGEKFLWDNVRNKLDLAFSMRRSAEKGKVLPKEYYINEELKYLEAFSNIMIELKRYLK